MFEKVFLGPLQNPDNQKLTDLKPREILTLLPLLVVIFWIGLYPQFFFNLINPTVNQLVAWVH
jgi:NADH-quinone oxidoreductase subunit M